MPRPTDMDLYLFDLRGYLLLKGALDEGEVAALNAGIDAILPLKHGEWYGYVHGHTYGDDEGLNLQQIYEAGEPFEQLIDHPSWIEWVKTFVGGEGTFDYHHGPLFIDENFASLRGPGEAIGLHSGGHSGVKRNQFRFHNGRFQCGQVNILLALTDIGPGDGATMVIPGSHKANLEHPAFGRHRMGGESASVDNVEGAIEVHMKAGDAILFVDAISHGSAERVSTGERRIIVYRYGPSWGNFRHGYAPSPELLARLTPERRQIVQPLELLPREPQKLA
ncbi:MAG: phytanoyl-CoA dioxygenase family protein [Trueperaceae bacterium]|nr:MAG: phytanoyl-CoA dioxygenase family protein [Trueperaceae bacterium]